MVTWQLVGEECDECADEGRAETECYTSRSEDLLDGGFVVYCSHGHVLHGTHRIYYKYFNRRWQRHSYLCPEWIKEYEQDNYELVSDEKYHRHSGYGTHHITTRHKKTEERGRRFYDLQEWKESRIKKLKKETE